MMIDIRYPNYHYLYLKASKQMSITLFLPLFFSIWTGRSWAVRHVFMSHRRGHSSIATNSHMCVLLAICLFGVE